MDLHWESKTYHCQKRYEIFGPFILQLSKLLLPRGVGLAEGIDEPHRCLVVCTCLHCHAIYLASATESTETPNDPPTGLFFGLATKGCLILRSDSLHQTKKRLKALQCSIGMKFETKKIKYRGSKRQRPLPIKDSFLRDFCSDKREIFLMNRFHRRPPCR